MKNAFLLLLVVALAVIPLAMHRPASGPAGAAIGEAPTAEAAPGRHELFSGSDDQASALITQLRPGYRPWASPLFEPPSAEIESLLFALQAALGAGALFYYLGYAKGRSAALAGRDAARAEERTVR